MAAEEIVEYLECTKKHQEKSFADVKGVYVVLGNESCDLDSAVSSLSLAYICTLKENDSGVLYIPVLNIKREKYHLKTETTYLFRDHGIKDDLLTFRDEIDLHDLNKQQKLKLLLVDHNVLTERYKDLECCVVTVIDHRPQVRQPDDRVKITISPVGSCSTLVAREFFNLENINDGSYDKSLLVFLYGAILIDTINLSPAAQKMTADDKEMAGKLQQMLPDIDGEDLFNSIQKAKTDKSELSTLDLFEKDLKVVPGMKVKMAISSISIDLQSFLCRPNISEDIESFVHSQGAIGLVVMMIHEKSPGEVARDILIYCPESVMLEKVQNALLENKDPALELSEVQSEFKHSICYHQGCIKASRKQVLPIIQTVISEYESDSKDQSNNSCGKDVNLLGASDLLNFSGDQSNSNQPELVTSHIDDFDLLNLSNNQSSKNQTSTSSNQNLMDEFDIFSSNKTSNTQENTPPGQTESTLNFDLLGSSDTTQSQQTLNVDLLGGLDPFSSTNNNEGENKVTSPIPEININEAVDIEELDEADVMFHSSNLDAPHSGVNSASQGSSAHTSEPGSAFASYPVTPPNSFIDSSGTVHMKDFTLPSLNSAEMLEKIREKKGRLRSTESTSTDVTDAEGSSVPYTPQNSYMEGAFEQYAAEHHLPSFNSMEMVQRIKEKRVSMETSRFDEDDSFSKLRTESGEVTPFTPHNSYRDVSVLEKNYGSVLDHNKLHQSLSTIETSAAEQEVDDTSLKVNERTDSGLLIFDTSNVPNPTDLHNNVVAVGLAQEMAESNIADQGLLDLSNEHSAGGGDGMMAGFSSSNIENGFSQDITKDSSTTDYGAQGGNTDQGKQQDELVLHQSIEEFAASFTNNLIEDAICTFPGHIEEEEEDTGDPPRKNSPSMEVNRNWDNLLMEGRQLDLLESPSTAGATITPSPEELPVETDYLSSVDPMRGNLDLVKGSESKEIVESISFRKISGEEPQTVRQEILALATQREESNDMNHNAKENTVHEYAATLVNHVITSAMTTVTKGENVNKDISSVGSSDTSEASGVTWSRETSFDTVSSLPGKDGRRGLLSNQGSWDTPLSSIDKYSGCYSFDSDDNVVTQEGSNGQTVSSATQEAGELYLLSDGSNLLNSESLTTELGMLTLDQNGASNDISETKTQNSEENLEISILNGNDSEKFKLEFSKKENLPENKKASDESLIPLSGALADINSVESVNNILSENEADNHSTPQSENEAGNHSLPLSENEVGYHFLPQSENEVGKHSKPQSENEAGNHSLPQFENEVGNTFYQQVENIHIPERSDESVPYNLRTMDSMDYISSEGEADNLEKLQAESASLISQLPLRSTYQKADTLDFISSENEAQDTDLMLSLQRMNSSQSSDVTSTTTEGSYQVLSPDRQLNDIKGETTPVVSDQMQELSVEEVFPVENVDGESLTNERSHHLNSEITSSHDIKVNEHSTNNKLMSVIDSIENCNSNETICKDKIEPLSNGTNSNEGSECNKEEISYSKGDNTKGREEISVFNENVSTSDKNISNNVDKVKEVYTMSAGRISIASEGDSEKPKPCVLFAEDLIEEVHKEDDLKGQNRLNQEQTEVTTQAQATSPDNPELATESEKVPQEGETEDQQVKSESQNQLTNEEATVTKKKKKKKKRKGMEVAEEWHEDPIPGMDDEVDDDDLDSISTDSQHSGQSDDSSDSTRPANRPTSLQTRKKKRISAHFNILNEDYASPDEVDHTDNAGDLEWENDTPVSIPTEPIPEYSAEDEFQDAKHWRGIEINGKQRKIDLKVIEPYKKVLSHGGYYGDGLNAIIVFSGCYLPDRNRKDYNYVMDNLFMYVISTLELLVAEDYMIVYFHGATPRRQMPSFGWLKKCYQMIDRRLKKNLKALLLIHPTLWLRTIVLMTKPFISSKFSSKLKFVRSLHELSSIVPMEYIYVPEQVQKYDNLLQHRSSASSTSSTSAPHTPP